MPKQKHTAEPWRVTDGPSGPQVRGTCDIGESDLVADAKTADAIRIAACVNACELVATENLKPMDMHRLVLDLDEAKRKAAALNAAARRICDLLVNTVTDFGAERIIVPGHAIRELIQAMKGN